MSEFRPINTSLCLEKICESNYLKLFNLIPNLCCFDKAAIGLTQHKPALYLYVLERNPYTLTIELNHCVTADPTKLIGPGVRIRVYLDAQLAEVIRDDERPTVANVFDNPGKLKEIRDYKWRLNYFLQKWLDHCLQTNYRFEELLEQVDIV